VGTSELSDFIRSHGPEILRAWKRFAASLPSAHGMASPALHDHAEGMLRVIANDLEAGQTLDQQEQKARGKAPAGTTVTQASLHGAARMRAGFSIVEEVSEFRALRASVQQLWNASHPPPPAQAIPARELMRFNEAIDQALGESVARYSADKERNTRLFDQLLSSSPDLNYIFDPEGRILYANKALVQLFDLPQEGILGKTFAELGASFAGAIDQGLRRVVETRANWQDELSYAVPGGVECCYEYLLVPVLDAAGAVEAITGTARDITRRKASEDASKRSANYDQLTGLPNRNLFREHLGWEVHKSRRSGQPIALFFIDLDGFKDVNDRLGHHAGDLLLQQAAQRIGDCVRGVDAVARLSGDEFTVIVTAANRVAEVELIAGKILAALARPFVLPQEAQVTASIGITFFPRDAVTPEDLVRNADQAMYVAKKSGRNRFSVFTRSMRDAAGSRLKVMDELRLALARQQLEVYYQPIVEVASGRIVKAEAVLRWNHPEAGLLLPAQFIGLAEEAGLIGPIDDWVWAQAVQRAREWSALRGAPFQVSVNRSPQEFASEAPLGPGGEGLAVEITEAVLLSDSPRAVEKLAGLRAAGIGLTIEDFGTGYSSIVDLQRFAVDSLKVEPFAPNPAANVDSKVIAETTIVMAHKLGMEVIAEGVETAQQRDWLRTVDCDFAQGNFFSPPVPAQAFAKLLDVAPAS
jgi:diguanylate cyclase (GGDEF)-like protein/PAS domain S-box-containing protein